VREKRLNEIKGVILVAIGLMVLASMISFNRYDLKFYISHPNIPPKNLISTFGAYLANALLFLFGWSSYAIPLFILWLGVRLFQQKISLRIAYIIGILLLLLSLSSFVGMFNLKNDALRFARAGFLGFAISTPIGVSCGQLGGVIIFSALIILALALVSEILISSLLLKITDNIKSLFRPLFKFALKRKPLVVKQGLNDKKDLQVTKTTSSPAISDFLKPKIQIKAKVPDQEPKIKVAEFKKYDQEPAAPKKDIVKEGLNQDYKLPSLDLLDSTPPPEARQIKEDLANNARILEETLEDFGISVKVTDIERGPVITRYELEPAPGIKVNRIVALGDDIALAMKAQTVRIVAPIPGKSRVGVEVPNIQSSFVYLKEVLSSKEFQETKSKLTLALAKDITGQPVVADLGDMPHLLIAGTTGSGKTVCVNSIILSLLFRNSPAELKLLMIDPKMVELMPFNGLSHLLCPVVTDAKKAAVALNWVVNEMEERYRL
jgi:S-DNA-T family DNA segregation ATPase FtsK/SpoIIIE